MQYSTYSPHPLCSCTAESLPPSAPPGLILCGCSASTPLTFFTLLMLLLTLLLTLLHSSSCSSHSVLLLLRMPHSQYSPLILTTAESLPPSAPDILHAPHTPPHTAPHAPHAPSSPHSSCPSCSLCPSSHSSHPSSASNCPVPLLTFMCLCFMYLVIDLYKLRITT